MNREIKFRVWDNWDYMSTPFTLQDIQSKRIEFTSDVKLMQYTGLKDKNGIEVYEGDIIAYDENSTRWLIEWREAGFFATNPSKEVHVFSKTWFASAAIVIGNIYENPELLA
jgi:hypothetical protein